MGNNKTAAGCLGFGALVFRSIAVAIVALGVQQPVQGQQDPGRFEVRSASVELQSGVYYLDAWVEYRLSFEAREALEAGVALTLQTEVEFLRDRRFWFDDQEASLRQSYELQYRALSARYLVMNLNSGEQSSFATLFSALNFLGRVTELPLIDAALLDSDAAYDIRIRAVLSTDDIPG
ncbi:MAG: DUF4390 domain-containing protein, partial [Gammaproteobacteria bacterium]